VITGTRAEFGLLEPLLRVLKNDGFFELKIAVTGMHLSEKYGFTYKEVESAGYEIDAKIDIDIKDTSPFGVANSTGMATSGFGEYFAKNRPDILIGLGDRFELMGAVTAATVFGIPVAHIHGGELSEGVIDDAFRHSITKMSALHFAAADEYRERIIQLGENPERVFVTGSPGLDVLDELDYLDRLELQNSLGMMLDRTNFLITFHPVAGDGLSPARQTEELLNALGNFDANFIFTGANADVGGETVNRMIEIFCAQNSNRANVYKSLGRLRYLSAMKICDCVIGNSSSGLIEAPSFKKPTVNIGTRQDGRVRGENVIDCIAERSSILDAIEYALTDEFKLSLKKIKNPYGGENASEKIAQVLKNTVLSSLRNKKFYDIEK